MQYELIQDSDMGVIIDPTPIMHDIKDTFTVSFDLPEPGVYVALFRDENGVEYRTTVKDGAVKVPKQLLVREQRIGLTVCRVADNTVLHSWECMTLKVGAFLSLRQTQWQITAGADDRELLSRFAEIERANVKARAEYSVLLTAFEALQAEFTRHSDECDRIAQEYAERHNEMNRALVSVRTANEYIATEYNKSVAVINDLSERLGALEKNYDPTLIK